MPRIPLVLVPLAFAACVGCGNDILTPTLPPDVRVDTYAQEAASRVDVLWIVDNSGSMGEEQENLAENFRSFIEIFTRGSIDYRIAVTTTDIFRDQGQFKGSPKILSPATGNVVTAFQNNISVGTTGSPFEAGLDAAEMALERQKQANATKIQQIESCKAACPDANCSQNCVSRFPIDFLRPNAYLYLIFVSDEEDRSRQDVRYYWRAFETSNGVGNDGTVTTAAIVGTQVDNPCAANHGSRYLALSDLTGGERGSICDENFAVTLQRLASNAVGLRRKFALNEKPEVNTIKIILRYPCNSTSDVTAPCASVNTDQCTGEVAPTDLKLQCTPRQGEPDGWVYEAENNLIFFSGDSVPGLKAHIDIQYYPEGKGP